MRYLLLLLAWLLASPALAQTRISLDSALRAQLVELKATGTGGYLGTCLEVVLTNLSPGVLNLEIPAGQQFASVDTQLQDFLITEPLQLALSPGATQRKGLQTMCTQSYNMAPAAGAAFAFGPVAEGDLLRLAEKIACGNYHNSTAQSAVWAVANRESHRHIYAQDTAMARDLARTVSEATGIPLAEFDLRPRRHQLTSINTSFELILPAHEGATRLELRDEQGELMRTYFSDRRLEKGFHQFKLGATHTLGDSTPVYLHLLNEAGGELARRAVFATDTVLPLQRIRSETLLEYDAPRDLRATIGVYGPEDQLYFLLAENHLIRRGFHRGRFRVGTDLPPGLDYQVKVKAGEQTLAAAPLSLADQMSALEAVREVRGVILYEMQQLRRNLRFAVFDAEGKQRFVLSEVQVLSPGRKRFGYHFSHHDGPEAVFFLRLFDPRSGEVLHEKKLEP